MRLSPHLSILQMSNKNSWIPPCTSRLHVFTGFACEHLGSVFNSLSHLASKMPNVAQVHVLKWEDLLLFFCKLTNPKHRPLHSMHQSQLRINSYNLGHLFPPECLAYRRPKSMLNVPSYKCTAGSSGICNGGPWCSDVWTLLLSFTKTNLL